MDIDELDETRDFVPHWWLQWSRYSCNSEAYLKERCE